MSDKCDGFKPMSIVTMLYTRHLSMDADATGVFVTAVARAFQFVGIFTSPDVKGIPSSMDDKKSVDAVLGDLMCLVDYMLIGTLEDC